MEEYKVHYPNFDVMQSEEHWDSHTREIVDQRLDTESFYPYQFFTQQEVDTLFHLCTVLLDERRSSIIEFVVHHFDKTLKANIGESQRKIGAPRQIDLIRDGLALLDQVCIDRFGNKLHALDKENLYKVVNLLVQGSFTLQIGQKSVPATDFMDKIVSESVSAYYSHPHIWSEIGYAGPAYPRGYVRSELGLTDPWEAKRDDK